MTAPMSAPTSAIGYATDGGALSWWRQTMREPTPELRWPRSVEVYEQMRRQDAQVQSVIRAVTLPVRRTPWRIDPAGARPEVVALVAEDLGLPVEGADESEAPPLRTRDRFSWSEHLSNALLSLVFGHAFFEQEARIDDAGRARLRKLALRPSHTLSAIHVARDGGLESIEQRGTDRPIPVSRLVAYVHEREAANWVGQALALDTPVPTPGGWTTMGELAVGNEVFDESGAVRRVVATRRWSDRPCFRLRFGSGEEIVADANHRWLSHVRSGQKRAPQVVTTAEMAVSVTKYGQVNHAVPLTAPLDLPDADLPIDPYVLGYWLGDGARGSARIVTDDSEVAGEFDRRGYRTRKGGNWERYRAWLVTGLGDGLRAAGVFQDKHVPDVFLRASQAQRIDLLRGLMDADGHVQEYGTCTFSNTDPRLVSAVVDLAAGLGARTRVQYVPRAGKTGTRRDGQVIVSRKDLYRVHFTAPFVAFGLDRKVKLQDVEQAKRRPYHYVQAVEIAENRETVCIEVDSPSHLYLCGTGMVPTHNSLLRPAYKHWAIKDRLLRVQAQTIERNGMGVPVYKDGPNNKFMAEGLKMAQDYRSGENAGASVPNGADLTLRGVEGSVPDADPAIRYHDEQIARSALLHFLNLGTQTGSWALGTTFAEFFTFSLQSVAEGHRDVAQQHVVEDLVDWNWGSDEAAPRIVFDEIGSRHAATAQAIKMLVDAGALSSDPALERHLRQAYGLPSPDPDAPAPNPVEDL